MEIKREFSLESWLKKGKTQKVVTADNFPVTILTNTKRDSKELIEQGEDYPIVALISIPDPMGNWDIVEEYNRQGKIKGETGNSEINISQLYIIENEITSFEKELSKIIDLSKSSDKDELIEEFAPKLSKIAEEEIKSKLPKWKICNDVDPELTKGQFLLSSGKNPTIIKDGYEISLEELEILPKDD